MLWVDLFELVWGWECGSISAVEVGDGARYWRHIEAGVEYGETIKSPCGGRGFRWDSIRKDGGLVVLHKVQGTLRNHYRQHYYRQHDSNPC